MKHYQSNAQLKNLAKDKLTGKYGSAIWALLLVTLVTRAVTGTAVTLIPVGGWFWNIVSILLTAALSVFLGVLQTGIAYYFLNIACNLNYSSGNVFYGFHEHAERSIKVSLAHVALETICTLPYQILALVFIQTFDYKYILLAYAVMFLGYVVLAPFSLAISQSYYLLLDFPEATAMEVLKTSIRVMKGHKWRLFKLELSFLPLQIICMLSFGIGNLWLNPYMRMTYTEYFLDLMSPGKQESSDNYYSFENMGQSY